MQKLGVKTLNRDRDSLKEEHTSLSPEI